MKSIFVLDTNIIFFKIFEEIEVNGRTIWNNYAKCGLAKKEIAKLTNEG